MEPAILGAAGASNAAVVFPNAEATPPPPQVVTGMPSGALPHGVAYYGLDNALVADFGNREVLVVKISTASIVSTISLLALGYDYEGFGTIAVTPGADAALTTSFTSSPGHEDAVAALFNSEGTWLLGTVPDYDAATHTFNEGFLFALMAAPSDLEMRTFGRTKGYSLSATRAPASSIKTQTSVLSAISRPIRVASP